MLNDVRVFYALSNLRSSQSFCSQDPFTFLKSIENPRALSFMGVILLIFMILEIKTQKFKKYFNNSLKKKKPITC